MAYRRYVPIGVIHNSRRASSGTEGTERTTPPPHEPSDCLRPRSAYLYLRIVVTYIAYMSLSSTKLSKKQGETSSSRSKRNEEEKKSYRLDIPRRYRDGIAKREPVTVDRNFALPFSLLPAKSLFFLFSLSIPNPYSAETPRYRPPPRLS